MQNNFDPLVTDNHGKTPLDYANNSTYRKTKLYLQSLTTDKTKHN